MLLLKLYIPFVVLLQYYKILCDVSPNVVSLEPLAKDEMLQPADLTALLNALHKIVMYQESNVSSDVDVTTLIGLFLINVNLKWSIIRKSHSIPKAVRHKIEEILSDNYKILRPMQEHVINGNSSRLEKDVTSLLTNDRSWLLNMKSFRKRNSKVNYKSKRNYNKDNFLYKSYAYLIFDYEHIAPQPHESDSCLQVISKNPINFMQPLPQCAVRDEKCIDLLRHGTSYGYALTHRLVWLLMAHLARGCTFLSEMEDRELAEEFCTIIYNEAEYIAGHGFEISDLIMEQIALCGLGGNPSFFRRSWFLKLLTFQSNMGCMKTMNFQETLLADHNDLEEIGNKNFRFVLSKFSNNFGTCNQHVTAVAAGAVSSAVRFVIDMYF